MTQVVVRGVSVAKGEIEREREFIIQGARRSGQGGAGGEGVVDIKNEKKSGVTVWDLLYPQDTGLL
jgi:hypothetical protein